MVAIFDFPFSLASHTMRIGPIVFQDCENQGVVHTERDSTRCMRPKREWNIIYK